MGNSDYGPAERLMHRFALGSSMIAEMSFSLDQMLHKPEPDQFVKERHVFVSGLARAGTTALLRLLYETGNFFSLTYRNMPFPLAPSLWGNIFATRSRESELKQRAHGDGMLVGVDSPEALEEVFWRVFCGEDYIHPDRLGPMTVAEETLRLFQRYIAALLQANEMRRYLSKNNNNILRLPSIRRAFPNAAILVPYRDPLQQALSLARQHERFCEMHREDRFSRDYMGWLVHHEFGSDHRYFDFDGRKPSYSPEKAVYWLEQWVKAYRHILQVDGKDGMNLIFVDYEELCDNPGRVWSSLASRTGVPTDLPAGFELHKADHHEEFEVEKELLDESRAIQAQLKARFKES